ncbi:hypothetical protein ABW20_dc0103771 [Dactylellina cionopaga]|nr:hypothetical protein ABW20_dc0103771 [Dactylellina cionopaga]
MSASGQYKGSQAFNSIDAKNESVNQSTGSFSFSKALVELRGKREEINLLIKLEHSSGLKGTFGLPDGWGLDIPYVLPSQSITTQGRTYAIDLNWQDSTGYKSGLKYVNNHGMKFSVVQPPLRLPSNEPGFYAYTLRYSDGAIDYFDAVGKLLQHSDIFGNYHYYSYLTQSSGSNALNAFVASIKDSWGQIIRIQNEQGSWIKIIAPDGGTSAINFSRQGVNSLVDPLGHTTSFQYVNLSGRGFYLSEIGYPSGLKSRFNYTWIEYRNPSNVQGFFPAIQDLYHLEGSTILDQTNYRYGAESNGLTFTGVGKGYRIGGLRDGLMDAKDATVSKDRDGNILSFVCVWYNWLHLAVKQETFKYVGGNRSKGHQTIYSYNIAPEQAYRSASYNAPIQIETFQVGSSGQYVPLSRTSNTYNNYGNLTQAVEEAWDRGSSSYKTQTRTTKDYFNTQHGIQMLKEEIEKDAISGQEIGTRYELTAQEKAVKTRSLLERPIGGSGLLPMTTLSYTYDNIGRIVVEEVAWSPGAPQAPAGSVTTSVKRKTYTVEAGILTENTAGSIGGNTIIEYDIRRKIGPMTRKTLPLGQRENFSYDLIGRPIEERDALGSKSTTSYTVGSQNNTEKHISSNGLITLRTFDVLGRLTLVSDNGDPTQPVSNNPNRTVSRITYDSISRIRSQTDITGRTTTYDTYDSLNRLTQSTDPLGNITLFRFNDEELKTETLTNGRLRETVYRDTLNRIIKEEAHADSDDTDISYDLVTTTSYNGFSKEIQKTITQRFRNASAPSITLKDTTTEYNSRLAISAETVKGRNDTTPDKMDTVKRSYTFDILGNKHSYVKTTTYADGRVFTRQGPIDIYNQNNQLIVHRDQLGNEERYTHDDSGRLIKVTRPDGSEIIYTYDLADQVTQTRTANETVNYTYSMIGRLSRVQRESDTVEYDYNLDGTCRSVRFAGGLKQEYKFDTFSRIIQEKDVFGVTRDLQYNAEGLLVKRSCSGDTLSYTYGTANYTKGMLLSTKVTGGQIYGRMVAYDGFGRTNKVTFINRTLLSLLDTEIKYNARGQIHQIMTTSNTHDHKELKQRRQLVYDGCGHLVADSISYLNTTLTQTVSQSSTRYTYDGNSNVVSKDVDGNIKNMRYNELDQRVDPGFSYDRVGRMLTDDTGRRYEFDNSDRLTSVTNPSKPISRFLYRSDDSLSHYASDTTDADIYFSQKRINAMRVQEQGAQASDSSTSLLSESGRLVAAYQPSDSTATYFVENQGSNVMAFDKNEVASVQTYGTYGEPTEQTFHKLQSSFGFKQEFTDPVSGLVYLRSRYYSPGNISFISPDAIHKENRYAYCSGDPINFVDPTGNSREAGAMAAGIIVGIIIGAIVSVLSAGTLTEIGVALGTKIGVTTTAIITGTISGAAGNIAGGVTAALIKGEAYTGTKALVDGITGAVGGVAANMLAPVVGPATGVALNRLLNAGFPVKFVARLPMKALSGLATKGVAGGLSQGPKQYWVFLLNIPVKHIASMKVQKLTMTPDRRPAEYMRDFKSKLLGDKPRQTEKNESGEEEEPESVLIRGLLPDSANWASDSPANRGSSLAMPVSSQESFSIKEIGLGYGGALKFYGGMRI